MNLTRATIEKFRKGETSLNQVFQIDANQIAALLLIGHTFLTQGKLQEARNIFEGLAVLDPANPYLYAVLGSIYQQQEQSDLAVRMYSASLRIFPGDVTSLTNRGECYLKLGKFHEAAADFARAISLDSVQKHPAANRARFLAAFTLEALKVARERGTEVFEHAKKSIQVS